MKKAIECVDYSFRYASEAEPVLQDCSFSLHYGEFMLLSGISGEGKSTLLSAINGAIPNFISGEQHGDIFVEGKSVRGKKMAELARSVGSVLQNAEHQIIHAKVEDEIAFGCENMQVPPDQIKQRIKDACLMMQLEPGWPTRTLSGGQKQRLITASILAMGQKILVFDEPLANIDLTGSHILLQALKKLARQGYAILFIEHRLDVVIPYADTLAWLENGSIRMIDNKSSLLRKNLNIIDDTGAASISSEPCFEVSGLSYQAAGREIIRDISLTIRKGERLVILGENGSGKTTLIRLLARLEKPHSGTIKQNILPGRQRTASPAWFRQVGYVYQNPNYQLFMAQVADEINYQSSSMENTMQYLDAYALKELADVHPHALSEGQKRRIGIAAIQAGQPSVLILDEPTVGQDYSNLKNLVETINYDHKRRNTTMITVTHDYRCAAALADQVIWLQNGRIYRQGGKDIISQYFSRNL